MVHKTFQSQLYGNVACHWIWENEQQKHEISTFKQLKQGSEISGSSCPGWDLKLGPTLTSYNKTQVRCQQVNILVHGDREKQG